MLAAIRLCLCAILLLAAVVIYFAGCDRMDSTNPMFTTSEDGSVMKIAMQVATDLGIEGGEITISKGELVFSQPLEFEEGQVTVVFSDLQPGIWLIAVQLWDEDGFILYEGDGEAEVHGNETTTAHIVLTELTGELEVIIELPPGSDTINWVTDLTIVSPGATGLIVQNGEVIDVTYSGHVAGLAPTSYWEEGDPPPYTGNPVVGNPPTLGIKLVDANSASPDYANILTFSLPLIDPVFALYSVGYPTGAVPYEFDQSFTLLSEGEGRWGDGWFEIDGNTLTGWEGHGVIQFYGTISSIAWNNPVRENHHGFTVGVQADGK